MSEETQTEVRKPKYMDKFHLLNKAETELFNLIRQAAPSLYVFVQVSMSQIFYMSNRQKAFTQVREIGRKSIDFLLCREDMSIVVAIELNGPKHETEKQKISDEKKRATLEEAGIPLLILKPDAMPDVKTLGAMIAPLVVERKRYEKEKQERIHKRTPL